MLDRLCVVCPFGCLCVVWPCARARLSARLCVVGLPPSKAQGIRVTVPRRVSQVAYETNPYGWHASAARRTGRPAGLVLLAGSQELPISGLSQPIRIGIPLVESTTNTREASRRVLQAWRPPCA